MPSRSDRGCPGLVTKFTLCDWSWAGRECASESPVPSFESFMPKKVGSPNAPVSSSVDDRHPFFSCLEANNTLSRVVLTLTSSPESSLEKLILLENPGDCKSCGILDKSVQTDDCKQPTRKKCLYPAYASFSIIRVNASGTWAVVRTFDLAFFASKA